MAPILVRSLRGAVRLRALLAASLLVACGTSARPAPSGCPEGASYCAACGGDGFCSQGGCPTIACPGAADAAFDASGSACGAGQIECNACNGGGYCAQGSCPQMLCPTDAGVVPAQACDGSLCGYCPQEVPANGSACSPPAGVEDYFCSWGDHPAATQCRTTATCATSCTSNSDGGPPTCEPSGTWEVNVAPDACSTLSAGCPTEPQGPCTAPAVCVYPDGHYCNCASNGAPNCIAPPVLPESCPSQIPNAGTTCSLPSATTCVASACQGTCGFSVACREGVWTWITDCACLRVCASPDTPIATPDGERRIADLGVGDMVYSVDRESIRAVPIARIRRLRVENHRIVRLTTSDGRTLEISAPHPTADGRLFGDLRAGDSLDGHAIESVELVDYTHDFTYDILPGSGTGTYFAAGMQIGSTLR